MTPLLSHSGMVVALASKCSHLNVPRIHKHVHFCLLFHFCPEKRFMSSICFCSMPAKLESVLGEKILTGIKSNTICKYFCISIYLIVWLYSLTEAFLSFVLVSKLLSRVRYW